VHQRAHIIRCEMLLRVAEGVFGNRHGGLLQRAAALCEAVLQAVELQIIAEIIRRFLQILAVYVEADGVHAVLQGDEAGCALAAHGVAKALTPEALALLGTHSTRLMLFECVDGGLLRPLDWGRTAYLAGRESAHSKQVNSA